MNYSVVVAIIALVLVAVGVPLALRVGKRRHVGGSSHTRRRQGGGDDTRIDG